MAQGIQVKFTPAENPPGKLADGELHFLDGPLAGLRLIGFAVWERRSGTGRNVTFPARQYSVNGERRSYALLRPSALADPVATDRVRDLVLEAYAAFTGETRDAGQDAAAAEAMTREITETMVGVGVTAVRFEEPAGVHWQDQSDEARAKRVAKQVRKMGGR